MEIESLANAELAVMELLWETDRLTARQIRDELYPGESRSANGTVQSKLRCSKPSFLGSDDGASS